MSGEPQSAPPERPRYDDPRASDPPPESSWGKLLALVPEGSRVLDIGCARGGFSAALKKLRRCFVVGIEIDPEAAEEARRHCDEVIAGDAAELVDDIADTFDIIIAADVLEHLVDPALLLTRIGRLLRPGGALLASIPNVTHASVVLALAQGEFPRSREGLLDSTHLQFFGETDVLGLFHRTGWAARVADSVRLNPPVTEFHSNLAVVPPAVLEFLDRNPNADTYQFIIRAVPRAHARDGDDQPAPATLPEGGRIEASLALEARALREELRRYHEALTEQVASSQRLHGEVERRDAELERRNGELAEARVRFDGLVRKAEVAQEIGEILDSRRWAGRARAAGPLTPGERKRLSVLFITDREDAPFRYRCVNATDQLRRSGAAASVMKLDDARIFEESTRYSILCRFRRAWSDRVARLIESAHGSGAKVAFDVDDLVFDPTVEQSMSFLARFPPQRVAQYR